MAAVHPQPSQDPLPPGWECRYDPRTGRYYFLNHVEHITTWEDPRLRYPQVQQTYPPYYGAVQYPVTASVAPPPPPPPHTVASPAPVPAQGSSGGYYSTPRPMVQQEGTIQVDERTLMKLCLQFPTVEEGHIWQLLKQYHNREHVVVSALLAEGHPRAQTHSMVHEHLTPKLQRQTEAPVFQVDEALYHKLRNFFPAVDGDHIRNLQKIHNNQEHEVIAALVAGNRGNNSRHQSPHPSSPKMKLRYLKLVFPEVDEAVLFDVLNNCDNNAQEASNRLIGMGYKKRDTPITRPNSSQPLQRPMSEIPRPSLTPERPIIVVPPSASDKLQLVSRLQEQFPAISRTLVNMALDSSNYNEDRAKQFLTAMTPQDGGRSAVPQSEAIITTEAGGGTMQIEANQLVSSLPSEAPPVPPRSRHASASQESDTPSGSRHSSTERHSLRGDNSSREGTPSKSPSHRISSGSPAHKLASCSTPERSSRPKFKKEVMKISKATSTQDDHENMSVCRTRPKGPDPSLRKGPCDNLLLYVPSTLLHGSNNVCMHGKEYMPWIGPDPKNHKGPDPSLWRGPDPSNLGARNENRAKGPQRALRRGPLANITHSKISSTTTTNLDAETDNSRSS